MRKILAALIGVLALSAASLPASANAGAGLVQKPVIADAGVTKVYHRHHGGIGFGIGLGLPFYAYGYPRHRYYDDDYRPRYYGGSRYSYYGNGYRSGYGGGYGAYGGGYGRSYGHHGHHHRSW